MTSSARLLLAAACTLAVLAPAAPANAEVQKAPEAPKASESSKAKKPKKPKKVDCSAVKCIALTFDDGPSKYAGELLDIFKKHKVKATFFLEGQYVKSRPAFAKRMAKEGHDLGNHSYTHPHFPEISDARIRQEITRTQDVVHKATGVKPKLLRPPYGEADDRVLEIATQMRMPVVLWNAGSRDWALRDANAIYEQVMSEVKPGAVVLMHDWVRETIDAMPRIVTALQKQGYHLVNVSTLFQGTKLVSGEIYPRPEWEIEDQAD
jgi:peptidoglycan/xylan/chitin deacetylase (PgdA/CDA1 family)